MRRKLIKTGVAATQAEGLYFSSPKEHIEFIRSGCTMLDCVMGGGWPLGRVSNIVGDKSTGKTLVAIEASANLLMQYPKGRVRYNETEAAFDVQYAEALGVNFDRIDMIQDCRTVEDLFRDIDTFAEKNGNTPALYVLDSLDAMSDEAEMAREIGDPSYGAAKAKKLSEFFRRKVQELKSTNIHLMVISQIRDNMNAGPFTAKHSRSGGKALDFYVSQVVWLSHRGQIKRQVKKVERVVGVDIEAKNTKNKVGLPYRKCEFEITFGFGIEDDKASRSWLKDVDGKESALEGDALREAVIKRWFEVEKSFLPTRRKYSPPV